MFADDVSAVVAQIARDETLGLAQLPVVSLSEESQEMGVYVGRPKCNNFLVGKTQSADLGATGGGARISRRKK